MFIETDLTHIQNAFSAPSVSKTEQGDLEKEPLENKRGP